MFKSYDHFEDMVRQLYGNPNKEREAEQKLEILKQTGSATEYLSKFQLISSKVK